MSQLNTIWHKKTLRNVAFLKDNRVWRIRESAPLKRPKLMTCDIIINHCHAGRKFRTYLGNTRTQHLDLFPLSRTCHFRCKGWVYKDLKEKSYIAQCVLLFVCAGLAYKCCSILHWWLQLLQYEACQHQR